MGEWIKGFRELRVWQQAFELAADIHNISKSFPSEERFALTDQVHRSSRSVAANIAEAWGKRRYPASSISRLNDSQAEAYESQSWLLFAVRFGHLDNQAAQPLIERYDQLIQSIDGMVSHANEWKPM